MPPTRKDLDDLDLEMLVSGPAHRRERKMRMRTAPIRIDGLIRFMAYVIATDDPEWAEPAREAIGRMPPTFPDDVTSVVSDLGAQLLERGWTEEALDDLEHALVWDPPGTEPIEHDLRLAALLGTLLAPRAA